MPYVPEPIFSAKRITAIAAVVLLHIGIVVAIQNGLARDVVNIIKG